GWTTATTGAAVGWRLENKTYGSPVHAFYQQASQAVAGTASLTSPTFSLVGKTTASLHFRHRYRISLAEGTGPGASDGYAVQVSTNGGATWTSIAPATSSASSHGAKTTGGTCSTGGTHTGNTVAAAPGGLYAGEHPAWGDETVDLTP